MKLWTPLSAALLALAAWVATAQSDSLRFPKSVAAGSSFTVSTSGSGSATLFIAGLDGVVERKVQLGEEISLGPEDLHNAGHYVAVLVGGSSSQSAQFDVIAQPEAAKVSFLAKPSRVQVNLASGVSGVTYLFDAFRNLIIKPQTVSFELSDSTGGKQSRTATSKDGVAWVRLNSAPKAGAATFQAVAGPVEEKRIIQQVPGDPCTLRMSAHASSAPQRIALETDPVHDCNGNPIPDGTVVSFTETYAGTQTTVDVPLKRGVAKTELPANKGAVISVAAGVVLGNEIHWNGGL